MTSVGQELLLARATRLVHGASGGLSGVAFFEGLGLPRPSGAHLTGGSSMAWTLSLAVTWSPQVGSETRAAGYVTLAATSLELRGLPCPDELAAVSAALLLAGLVRVIP